MKVNIGDVVRWLGIWVAVHDVKPHYTGYDLLQIELLENYPAPYFPAGTRFQMLNHPSLITEVLKKR